MSKNDIPCAIAAPVDKVTQLILTIENVEEITIKLHDLIARLTGQGETKSLPIERANDCSLEGLLNNYPEMLSGKIERALDQINEIHKIIY